jgi:hypothetical protein
MLGDPVKAFAGLFGQQLRIHPPVVIDPEDRLAVVAALSDVMGTSDRNASGQSGHKITLQRPFRPCQ